jgi:hypothetical protein
MSHTILGREMYVQWWEVTLWSVVTAPRYPWIIFRNRSNVWTFVRLGKHCSEAQEQQVNANRIGASITGSDKIIH